MEKHMGPYRATKLWNDVIHMFRQGMPVSRHRRYMKSYDVSFSAVEALDWLHAQLQINPNFGPTVSRAQALQLLEKFQKARVFEDVRGAKHQERIAENGRLYRFSKMSPTKARTPIKGNRAPLATRATANIASVTVPPTKLDFEKEVAPPTEMTQLPSYHLVANNRLSREEVEQVWTTMTLASLQKSLQLSSLGHILDPDLVNAQHIGHNMTHVNKNGVVCNIDKQDQLPYWILSAMRCLAHWPNKVEDNLPDYPGFEKDVFKVVKDYFEGLSEPLLTFSMYEVFTNVFVCAENIGRPQAPIVKTSAQSMYHSVMPGWITSFASVENLLMDLTMNGTMEEESPEEAMVLNPGNLNMAFHPAMVQGTAAGARSCDPRVNGVNPRLRSCNTSRDIHHEKGLHTSHASTRTARTMRRNPSTLSMPLHGDRLETSFGVDNEEPRTHIRTWNGHGSCDSEDYSFYDARQCGLQNASRVLHDQRYRYPSSMSIETNYGEEESFLPEQKCFSTNDVSQVQPGPENELARHHTTFTTSYNSLSESVADWATYGYTVVLSTTPKSEHHRRRHQSAGHIQCYDGHDSTMRHANSNSHQCQPHAVHIDHDYYKQANAAQSEHTQQSRTWKSSMAPPPYIPPPSYQQHSRRTPSDLSSSHSSYETAPSRPGTPASLASLEDVFYSDQEPQRGKHHHYQYHPQVRSSRRPIIRGSHCSNLNRARPKYTTPFGSRNPFSSHSLQLSGSVTSLFLPLTKSRVVESLRVCCLLLPPPNRRKLHLLLRLMVKISENGELNLDLESSTRDLVHRTFTRCILKSSEEADFDEMLAMRIVYFMMDNYSEIMMIPEDLKLQIEERIAYQRRTKVSTEEFERQKMTTSQQALNQLLEGIINNTTMAEKERKRHLKQFQKTHPEVYLARFPAEPKPAPRKPRIKPALLSRPLIKIKSFRM